ncbi:hypothetical protein [Escherichia coli]|nr:hypothetical protein [Escherichia coli]
MRIAVLRRHSCDVVPRDRHRTAQHGAPNHGARALFFGQPTNKQRWS